MPEIAASAYGGPGGAAAYAAWLTYSQTKDVGLALRVGAITGAAAYATGSVSKLPNNPAAIAQKTIMAGAIGGVAVAASGGDKQAIQEGFLKSGGAVMIQSIYETQTTHKLDARISKGNAVCMATLDVKAACAPPIEAYQLDGDGKPIPGTADVRKLDPRIPHVGTWTKPGEAPIIGTGETSRFMITVSKYPGMNAMALWHDHLSYSMNFNGVNNVWTIVPTTAATYYGTGAPAEDKIRDAAVEKARKQNGQMILGSESLVGKNAGNILARHHHVREAPQLRLWLLDRRIARPHARDARLRKLHAICRPRRYRRSFQSEYYQFPALRRHRSFFRSHPPLLAQVCKAMALTLCFCKKLFSQNIDIETLSSTNHSAVVDLSIHWRGLTDNGGLFYGVNSKENACKTEARKTDKELYTEDEQRFGIPITHSGISIHCTRNPSVKKNIDGHDYDYLEPATIAVRMQDSPYLIDFAGEFTPPAPIAAMTRVQTALDASDSRKSSSARSADIEEARLDPSTRAIFSRISRHKGGRADTRSSDGLRRGRLPQHRRVLGETSRHNDGDGQGLHTRLRILQCRHGATKSP